MKDPIDGNYFHVMRDEKIAKQGQVVRAYSDDDGTYLILWFGRDTGEPTHYELRSRVSLWGYRFYRSREEWLDKAKELEETE